MKQQNTQSQNKSKTTDFMQANITLRKLQDLQKIPRSNKPQLLQTKQLKHVPSSHEKKYLFTSQLNMIYYGQFNSQGYPQSQKAIVIFPNGTFYEGAFVMGKQNGQGKLTDLDSSFSYNGPWKEGFPHGIGKEVLQHNIYQGNFVQGKKHGRGKQIYSDGSFYEGNFTQNRITGKGKYYCKNNVWEGQWVNGYLEGKGRQIIAKSTLSDLDKASYYQGQFKKGERSGHGHFKWGQKYEYEGQFSKGQLDGEGKLKFRGKCFRGTWKMGTQKEVLTQGGNSAIQKKSKFQNISSKMEIVEEEQELNFSGIQSTNRMSSSYKNNQIF